MSILRCQNHGQILKVKVSFYSQISFFALPTRHSLCRKNPFHARCGRPFNEFDLEIRNGSVMQAENDGFDASERIRQECGRGIVALLDLDGWVCREG